MDLTDIVATMWGSLIVVVGFALLAYVQVYALWGLLDLALEFCYAYLK